MVTLFVWSIDKFRKMRTKKIQNQWTAMYVEQPLAKRVWLRSTDTIPWFWVNFMGVVNTKSPCLYHELMSIPWVHVYTMSRKKEKITKIQLLVIQTYKLQKCRNTNYRYTKIQVKKYKWQKYRNINYRNTEIKITEVHKYKLQDYRNIS